MDGLRRMRSPEDLGIDVGPVARRPRRPIAQRGNPTPVRQKFGAQEQRRTGRRADEALRQIENPLIQRDGRGAGALSSMRTQAMGYTLTEIHRSLVSRPKVFWHPAGNSLSPGSKTWNSHSRDSLATRKGVIVSSCEPACTTGSRDDRKRRRRAPGAGASETASFADASSSGTRAPANRYKDCAARASPSAGYAP